MRAGRKPIPTAQKLLAGTWRADRANPAEPEPRVLSALPKPPTWLTPAGVAAWRRLGRVLLASRVLTTSDLAVLAVLCDAFGQYEAAAAALRARGSTSFVVMDSDGSPKAIAPWPEIKITRDTAALIARLAPEFGLTPSSRARVSALPGPPEPDPFAEFDRFEFPAAPRGGPAVRDADRVKTTPRPECR